MSCMERTTTLNLKHGDFLLTQCLKKCFACQRLRNGRWFHNSLCTVYTHRKKGNVIVGDMQPFFLKIIFVFKMSELQSGSSCRAKHVSNKPYKREKEKQLIFFGHNVASQCSVQSGSNIVFIQFNIYKANKKIIKYTISCKKKKKNPEPF